ncbi:hypothetical protein M758_9G119800 [Ceratodon purpureus]|nr:hypothetical protein M758_9G119800 [Ceratodon purpureus]
MIQVPMEDGHTGGELLVHHKGSVKSCDWHMASSLGFSSAIFFADCERVQQQKIKSGTQLCLIFDLVRRDNLSGKALRGEYISKKVGEAEAVLNHWMEGATEGKPKLAIPLRQRFPVEKLSFATLCGDDSIVVEILKNCKDKNGKPLLNLHLCLVEKYQTGKAVPGPDYCIDEEEESEDDLYNAKNHIMGDIDEESIDIGSWVGMESTDDKALKAFSRLGLDAKDFVVRVGEKAFHDEPTEVEFDMGWKAGCASTLQEWYQGTMLIVWSRGLSFSPARHGKKRQKSM